MDASVPEGDEGRGVAAISSGKVLPTCDPEISEWGNPMDYNPLSSAEYIGC